MAGESLLTTTELLAGLPDNTSGLIEAVDARNIVVSAVDGVGFWDDNDDVSFPLTIPNAGAGVPVDILSALTAPPATTFVGNYYRLDGNQHFVPSYVDDGIIVPPGTFRIVDSSLGLRLTKAGGTATEQFNIRGTKAGVPFLPGITVDLTTTEQLVVSNAARLIDVSLAEPLSLEYTPVNAVDLVVHEFRIRLTMVLV